MIQFVSVEEFNNLFELMNKNFSLKFFSIAHQSSVQMFIKRRLCCWGEGRWADVSNCDQQDAHNYKIVDLIGFREVALDVDVVSTLENQKHSHDELKRQAAADKR